MNTWDRAIQTIQLEHQALKTKLERFSKQVSCDHPKEERVMQKDVGYDVDEEGSEDQHLETCGKCGAQRFHIEHTKHGKSTGCWMAT